MKKHTVLFSVAALAIAAFGFVGSGEKSGIEVGEMVSAYHPKHVSGPDAGTDNCPPCTYGNRPAVQIWLNPSEDAKNVEAFAKFLNEAVVGNKKADLKGFLINLTHCQMCIDKVTAMAKSTPYQQIGIATLSSTDAAVDAYKVNTAKEIKNTVFVYKNKKVVAKFVNLKADEQGLMALKKAIAEITTL